MNDIAERDYQEAIKLPVVRFATKLIADGLREKYPQLVGTCKDVLAYHGLPHTLDVLHEALLFATLEGVIDQRGLELLTIAAVFHDSGYIKHYHANEAAGAEIAEDHMRAIGGYDDAEIQRVREMILCTEVNFDNGFEQLIRDPDDILQRVIADADVSNFGRVDAAEKSKLVFEELVAVGDLSADDKAMFKEFRRKMLLAHRWQTASARELREAQKQINIAVADELEI